MPRKKKPEDLKELSDLELAVMDVSLSMRATDVDRKQQFGEGFGHLWVRFMCGISFD